MEAKNDYTSYDDRSSWAEQWDNSQDSAVVPRESSGGGRKGGKYREKVGQGFEKTKAVASVGYKKVKEGTSSGFNWLKDKYQKTRNNTNKH